MRRALLALSVVTSVAVLAPASALAEDLTFLSKPIDVGTTIDQRTVMSFDMDMKMTMPDGAGMDMKMGMKDIEDKTVNIISVSQDGPSQLVVKYDERSAAQTMFGQTQTQENPVTGKTFTVTREAEGVKAEPSIAGEGLSELQGEFGQLEDLRGFVKNLGTSTVPIGQEVDLGALQKSGLLGAGPTSGAKMEKGMLKLTEKRVIDGRPHGVFDLDMRMVGSDPSTGMKMEMDMTGEVLIDTATGWMKSMDFSGPVSMTGSTVENGVQMDMTASGTFSMKTEVGYTQ